MLPYLTVGNSTFPTVFQIAFQTHNKENTCSLGKVALREHRRLPRYFGGGASSGMILDSPANRSSRQGVSQDLCGLERCSAPSQSTEYSVWKLSEDRLTPLRRYFKTRIEIIKRHPFKARNPGTVKDFRNQSHDFWN